MILQTKELDDFVKETDKYLLCPKITKQKFFSDLRNAVYEDGSYSIITVSVEEPAINTPSQKHPLRLRG